MMALYLPSVRPGMDGLLAGSWRFLSVACGRPDSGGWGDEGTEATTRVDVFHEAKHGADYLEIYVTKQGYDAEADGG
jgi:hypothetical protein